MSHCLVFATGGTGGHIFPALAIAAEASKRGHRCVFIGHKNGMEAEIIPKHGYTFMGVPAGKWDRSRPNPLEAFKVAGGLLQAIQLMRKLEPALTIGFGGFASFPAVAAARLLGKPYILHETNAFPGLVTRWFARQAKAVAASQAATYEHLPKSLEQHVVGHPIKEEKLDKSKAREQLGLPQKGLITYVTGGSQGSLRLNEVVPQAFTSLTNKPTVLHSTGKRWLKQTETQTASLSNYHTVGFTDATLAWSAADLAICRAGYGTLAEAAFHGVPTIMVPLPTAAENHQWHNAHAVSQAGSGWLIEETELASLARVWENALKKDTLSQASEAAKARFLKGASTTFTHLIEQLIPATEPELGSQRII